MYFAKVDDSPHRRLTHRRLRHRRRAGVQGARGMDLDDLKHGYMSITRWNTEVWDYHKPLVLQVC